MVFNEVSAAGFKKAIKECYRALADGGLLLMAVVHPAIVNSLRKRDLLGRTREGMLTMPGAGSLRLPVVVRSAATYRRILTESGFQTGEEEIFPTDEVLNAKSGLRNVKGLPVALTFTSTKPINRI